MRRLGEVREPGSRQGLTRGQAEGLLATARVESSAATTSKEGMDMAEAGRRFLAHKETLGLKRSSLMDYESCIRVHLVPFFGPVPLEQIDIDSVEAFMAAKRAEGKAIASVLNYTVILHAIFRKGVRRGWCSRNPVADVDKPRSNRTDPDIRFLTNEELEALLAATPTDQLGTTERVIYLMAAMTGMRRGELLALRWQDVDTSAGLIRVRRNYSRGEFGTPKTRRSSRTVPLALRLRLELEDHHARSHHRGDLDLVFCHPGTGSVFDPSRLRKLFQAAARRAGLRPVRFHDLRHTFGTRMALAGAPLRAVQEWMGHSDYRTTSLYADYASDLSQGAFWASRAFSGTSESLADERASAEDDIGRRHAMGM
jgi:integrase